MKFSKTHLHVNGELKVLKIKDETVRPKNCFYLLIVGYVFYLASRFETWLNSL